MPTVQSTPVRRSGSRSCLCGCAAPRLSLPVGG